jgi:hypothetical protein
MERNTGTQDRQPRGPKSIIEFREAAADCRIVARSTALSEPMP